MEILGHISFKKIFYCNVRTEKNWFDTLPGKNWIAFTVADNEDGKLIADTANKCLDKEVSFICCAGQLAPKTEEYFSTEIELRNIQKEQELETSNDTLNNPLITLHTNFSEGFWFASSIGNTSIADQHLDIDKVICIDMTENSVKKYLRDLIGKFNSGEFPSDSEFEEPIYDGEIDL